MPPLNAKFLSNAELAAALDSHPDDAARSILEAEAVRRFNTFARQEDAIQTALALLLIAAGQGPGLSLDEAQSQIANVLSEAWMPTT